MIDRQYGKLVFECDSCPETFGGDSDDFSAAWAAAKSEGWSSRKIADEWLHGCPKCGAPT
jgi:hypothetical protein